MKEWKRILKNQLLYAGVEKEEYQEIQDEILKNNQEMLIKCTWAALAIFGGLYLASWWIDSISGNTLLYMSVVLCMAILAGIQRTILPRNPQLVLPGSYVFLAVVYGYAILVGSIQSEFPATTFCVLMFAGPFLFVDKPYRMASFMIGVMIIFCMASHHWKEPKVASLDTINSICFVVLGIACNIQLLKTKAKGLIYSKKTALERDTDGLTGLLVKSALEREIFQYIKLTRDPGALIIIDLDNFKKFNDTKGHAYGDKVLELTGKCILKTFRRTDIRGRFGGDEFIVFLRGNADRKMVTEKLDTFRALMAQATGEDKELERVSQSIGVALYPEDGGDYSTLFARADEALYESKRRGKDQYCFYTSVRIQKSQQVDAE